MSQSPRRSAARACCGSRSVTRNCTPGCSFRTAIRVSGINTAAALGKAAMRIVPDRRPVIASISASARLICGRTVALVRTRISPASVRVAPDRVRCSSGVFKARSTSEICWETAGWE